MRLILLLILAFVAMRAIGPAMQRSVDIIIGDSHALLIHDKCPGLHLQRDLCRVGWGSKQLQRALYATPQRHGVRRCYVSIGCNDGYALNGVEALIYEIKSTFPGAEIILVPGSIGWGGVSKCTPAQVAQYCAKWQDFGCTVLPVGVGSTPVHPTATDMRGVVNYINN